MAPFHVVVTDPLVPSVDVEREIITTAGGTLGLAGGDRAQVLDAARFADALLNTYFVLDRPAIENLERCRIIARYGIGVDNVDLDAASEHGIVVTNVPDYCVEEVAVHALALMLAHLRRVPLGDEIVKRGSWGADTLGPIRRVSTLTVGIVGFGKIARRFAELLRPFGCTVLVADPYVKVVDEHVRSVDLGTLLSSSDVVSLHCPLTPETRGLIDATALASMHDGAMLINVARGGLVVTEDVLAALRSGKLGAAALDTFEHEPPDAAAFRDVPHLLASPHSAFYSLEAIDESRRKAARQVVSLFNGEPLDYRVR